MGTPPLNDYTLPMDPSVILEDNTRVDLESEEYDGDQGDSPPLAESPEPVVEITGTTPSSSEVDGTYINQDHGPTTSSVQKQSLDTSKRVLCPDCGVSLYAKKGLKRHLNDKHSELIPCPECGQKIMGGRKLEAHLKRVHRLKKVSSSPGCALKPGKMREQTPMDTPFQVQSTPTSSQQDDYAQPPDFGPHEGEWRWGMASARWSEVKCLCGHSFIGHGQPCSCLSLPLTRPAIVSYD
ncbi:hypothetical protein BGW80DRAFT_1351685 [Lactifluus volemus]|nr:hypothetical protein BGW80DRAFT_1351685 [Lactifluus volemus]